MSLLMASAVMSAWLALWGPVDFNKIKEWQTLIGVAAALFVGWVAWANVSRQIDVQRTILRINIIGREEERIDKALPGLFELMRFFSSHYFLEYGSFDQLADFLEDQEDDPKKESIYARLAPEMPNVDKPTFHKLIELLKSLKWRLHHAKFQHSDWSRAEQRLQAEKGSDTGYSEDTIPHSIKSKRDAAAANTQFNEAREELMEFRRGIVSKAALFQNRRERFRIELERFFGS